MHGMANVCHVALARLFVMGEDTRAHIIKKLMGTGGNVSVS